MAILALQIRIQRKLSVGFRMVVLTGALHSNHLIQTSHWRGYFHHALQLSPKPGVSEAANKPHWQSFPLRIVVDHSRVRGLDVNPSLHFTGDADYLDYCTDQNI